MFEVSFTELLVVAVVALVVLGPEELPNAIRSVSKFIRSLKNLAAEVQQGIDSLTQEEVVKDLRKTLEAERRYIIDESGQYREVFDLSDMMAPPAAPPALLPEDEKHGNG